MADTPTPDADGQRCLVRLLRVAYPHPRFPDGPYERTAEAILAQAASTLWYRLVLPQGLTALDARAGGRFVDLDDQRALALLREIEDAAFFRFIRSAAVVTLYNDAEVWELLGYEGPSYDKGGYIHRGFDDLSWLPTPRIEEYSGPEPLVEVAPADQAAATEGERR